jgi:hypothetical protein
MTWCLNILRLTTQPSLARTVLIYAVVIHSPCGVQITRPAYISWLGPWLRGSGAEKGAGEQRPGGGGRTGWRRKEKVVASSGEL